VRRTGEKEEERDEEEKVTNSKDASEDKHGRLKWKLPERLFL